MTRIFISYRREDCPAHAGRLSDTLNERFGQHNVFMDVDTIDLGVDFVVRIQEAIGSCDVVLALIGDDWLTVKDRDGNRRIDQPDDFVRLEISTALARDDVRVIPVLVEGAEMPSSAELPDALASLARRNGTSLTDTQWRSDTSVVIRAIERVMGVDTEPPALLAPEPPADAAKGPDNAAKGERVERQAPWSRFAWMIPGFLSLGGISFIYFGLKAQERKWLIAGSLYMIPTLIGIVWSSLHPEQHPLDGLFIGPWLVAWLASVVHLFVIRPRYLARVGERSSVAVDLQDGGVV